jgi:hypothetical protein
MQPITVNLVMERLLANPIFKGLRPSTVSAWMKDFSSINEIFPIAQKLVAYVPVENYRGQLPPNVSQVTAVYVCSANGEDVTTNVVTSFDGSSTTIGINFGDTGTRGLDQSRFEDNKLGASLTDSILRDKDKQFYGSYTVNDDVITIDAKEAMLEVQYKGLRMDENGFPTLPYDGSLMMALTNFVKWQYCTILADNNMMPRHASVEAEKQYTWYIGQYVNKKDIPDYDTAVSWANQWTRLLNTRNKDIEGDNIEQHYNW